MAKMTSKPPVPAEPDVDPEALYRVTLARKVQLGTAWLLPRNDTVVKGKVLVEIRPAVASFERLED